jgi:hypothetical protein
MGPGDEIKLLDSPGVVPLVFGQSTYLFEHTVEPNKVPVEAGESTPYKLVATVVYHRPDGQPGPMAGFYEQPVLQFYKAIE